MRNALFAVAATALAAVAFIGVGSPAAAAPLGPMQVDAGASSIVEVQARRKRVSKRRGMRAMRSAGPGNPNASNPSRPASSQNTGQTSGGPRGSAR